MNWKAAADAVRWNIQPFIDGRYRPSAAVDYFHTVNPATETHLCRAPAGNAGDIDEAVTVARRRFDDGCWSGLAPIRRAEVLLKLADLFVKHKAELALLDTLEMGKPIQAALHDAEKLAASYLRVAAGFADKLVGQSAPMFDGTVAFNTYEPRGVPIPRDRGSVARRDQDIAGRSERTRNRLSRTAEEKTGFSCQLDATS